MLAGLQVRQIFLTFLRLLPDPPVKDYHYHDRNIKRGDGRAEGDVVVRLDELDVARGLRHGPLTLDVRPRVDPGWPKKQRYTPSGPWNDQRRFDYFSTNV